MLSVFNVCMLCTSMVPYVCSSVAMITCLASSPGLFLMKNFLSVPWPFSDEEFSLVCTGHEARDKRPGGKATV